LLLAPAQVKVQIVDAVGHNYEKREVRCFKRQTVIGCCVIDCIAFDSVMVAAIVPYSSGKFLG
jgi:hypothetical protein